jgi:hypothetical protein
VNEEKRKEKRLRYLQRVAVREARRKMQHDGRPPTKDELLQLKVKIWQPWLRITLMTVGGGNVAAGVVLIFGYHEPLGVAFGLIGIMIFFLGWWGRCQTVDESLKGYDATWIEIALGAILAALD